MTTLTETVVDKWCHTMSDGASGSPEAEGLTNTKKSSKISFGEMTEHGDSQAVTQPPLQKVLRSPETTCKKQKSSRRPSRRSSMRGPRLSASHIEEAAGDVSDLSASLLLACLFCHFSDCFVLIPGTCCSGLHTLCCLPDLQDLCCCPCSCCTNLDCDVLELCQNTAECLELAMEISELCYH
ncbi:uncharacterized protein LOC142101267 isoform X2 [Mixophyes fleayi]|uniref:uncharacterized protein LOC142101267 isoform X2 n=1 Tax=Mixophyes fleayi TaxID=3061075 RepID=UPI003F4DF122